MAETLETLRNRLAAAEQQLQETNEKADRADGRELDRLASEVSTAETLVRLLRRQVAAAEADERAREQAKQERAAEKRRSEAVAEVTARHKALQAAWDEWGRDVLAIAAAVPAMWRELGRLRRETDQAQRDALDLGLALYLPQPVKDVNEVTALISRGAIPGLVLPPREARS